MNDDEGVGVCDPMDLVPLSVDRSLVADVDLKTVTSQLLQTHCDTCSFYLLRGVPFVDVICTFTSYTFQDL